MQPNDPTPDSRPVLIVSDGEEGNLIEKVILEQNTLPSSVEQPAAETAHADHTDTPQQMETDEKSA